VQRGACIRRNLKKKSRPHPEGRERVTDQLKKFRNAWGAGQAPKVKRSAGLGGGKNESQPRRKMNQRQGGEKRDAQRSCTVKGTASKSLKVGAVPKSQPPRKQYKAQSGEKKLLEKMGKRTRKIRTNLAHLSTGHTVWVKGKSEENLQLKLVGVKMNHGWTPLVESPWFDKLPRKVEGSGLGGTIKQT